MNTKSIIQKQELQWYSPTPTYAEIEENKKRILSNGYIETKPKATEIENEKIKEAINYIESRLEQVKDEGTYIQAGNCKYLPISNLEHVLQILLTE